VEFVNKRKEVISLDELVEVLEQKGIISSADKAKLKKFKK